MVEFFHVSRWEKWNRTNFLSVMFLVCIKLERIGIHFHKKLCMKTWYNLISDFVGLCPRVYIAKYLKQFSTCYDSKCLNIFGAKCFNSFCE